MAHVAEWRAWLEDFAAELCPQDQLPVAVASYTITQDELPGAVLHWTDHYLSSKKCPRALRAALCRQAVREVTASVSAEPHTAGFAEPQQVFVPLKCMQAVVRRVDELCLRHLDNATLDALQPPPRHALSSSAAHKNSRRAMEDRHVDIPCLEHLLGEVPASEEERTSVYAVYDGHQGAAAATYCSIHLHQFLHDSQHFRTDLPAALVDAFRRTDKQFTSKERGNGGSTAVVVVRRGRRLVVAWAGDSKAMLACRGGYRPLVRPHKPNRADEKARILALGGCVLFCGTWRVNGHLAVSRAIGNRDFKPWVSAEPEILEVELTGDELLILVASDGLWDVYSERDAVRLARDALSRPAPPHDEARAIAEQLVCGARAAGSSDNVSVVAALLRHDVREQLRAARAMERHAAAAPDTDDDDLGPETPVDQELDEPPPPECAAEADNVAESGEESEDEWNYFQGEQQHPPGQKQREGAWEEDEESSEMNSSPLNPDAPVFVPGGADSPLLGDRLIAESPRKPLPIDDAEPDSTLFASEAGHRPTSPADGLDQLLNGDNKLLLEDMERVQRDTTLQCEMGPATPLAAHVDQQLLERLQSKERDPMSMSFYGEREEEPPSELDHVQPLPDSEEDEPESHKLLFEQIPETPHGKSLPNAPVEFAAGYAQLLSDPISPETKDLIPEQKANVSEPTIESQDNVTDEIDFMSCSKDQAPEFVLKSKDSGLDSMKFGQEKSSGDEPSHILSETKDFVLEPTNFEWRDKNPFSDSALSEIDSKVFLSATEKLESELSVAVEETNNFINEAIESEPTNLIDQFLELSLEPKQTVLQSTGFSNGGIEEHIQEQSDSMNPCQGITEFDDNKNESEPVMALIEPELSLESVIITSETVEAICHPIEPSQEIIQSQDIPKTESAPQHNEKISEPTTVEETPEPTNILDDPTKFINKDKVEFELSGDVHHEYLESLPGPKELIDEPAEISEPVHLIDASLNLADETKDYVPETNGFLHEATEIEPEHKHVILESEDKIPKTDLLSEVITQPSDPTPELGEPTPEPSEPTPIPSGPTPEPIELVPKPVNISSESADVTSIVREASGEVSSPVSAELSLGADISVMKESLASIPESNAVDPGVIAAGLATVAAAGAVAAVAAKTTPSTKKSKSVQKTPVSKTPASKTLTPKAATPTTKSGTPASKSATPAIKSTTPTIKSTTPTIKSTTPTTKAKVTNATSKPTGLAPKPSVAPKTSALPAKTVPATAMTKTTTKTITAVSKPASAASRPSTTASKLTTTASKSASAATKPSLSSNKTPAAPRPVTAAPRPVTAASKPTSATNRPALSKQTVPSKTSTVASKAPTALKPAATASKPAATASKLTSVASKTTTTTVASKTTSGAYKTTITTSRTTTTSGAKTAATAPKTMNGPARPALASAKRLTNGEAKPSTKTTAMPPPIRRQTADKSSKEIANKRLSASAAPDKSAESVAADDARAPSPSLPDVVA